MLRTRFLVSIVLIAVAVGVLLGDASFAPWYPFLLVTVLALGLLGSRELWAMLPAADRPPRWLMLTGAPLILLANWSPLLSGASAWSGVLAALVAGTLIAFLTEILRYSADGRATVRLAFAIFASVYFGVLPSCLVQQRWRADGLGGAAIAATIFVPKVGDIFALLTGLLLGRHKFTPLLSPKKTWEGFVGGMLAAVGTAIGFHVAVPGLFRAGLGHAIGFGFAVGLAGVFGDLAESLLKRDCGVKDASKSIPGFGGILDLIDSVLFAAPIAYLMMEIRVS